MSRKTHGSSIEFRPQHRLFAVFGDRSSAEAAVAILPEPGLDLDHHWFLEGEQGTADLDLHGTSHGVWARIVRTTQRAMSSDYSYLGFLESELRRGHVVLAVHVDDEKTADEMARRLVPFGGHGFAYFARWDFEPVAA